MDAQFCPEVRSEPARAVAQIAGVASALPRHHVLQTDIAAVAQRLFGGRSADFPRLASVFDSAGIEARHLSAPLEWYLEPHSWPEKNALYVACALELLEEAAWAALDRAGLRPADVSALVVVSSTGIATPSLDAHLLERMPFRRDVQRLPIFGLGCAGGVLGLARAAALAEAAPGANVLLLVVELCSLTFQYHDLSQANVVATALFGDGAAAVVLRAGGGHGDLPRLRAWGEHSWPGSLDVMGWRVEESGLGVIFAKSIPVLVRRHMRAVTEAFLARHGLGLQDIAGFVCHPGGRKVIEALRDAFGLEPEALSDAAAVLRTCGNMSAATVLFVLERRLASAPSGPHLMTAMGPGFSAGFNLLDL